MVPPLSWDLHDDDAVDYANDVNDGGAWDFARIPEGHSDAMSYVLKTPSSQH